MKFRHILNKKVIYSENLGDEYYYDYRIIVKINNNKIVLIEYNDSGSGYIPFSVESVDKEFISNFFDDYHNPNRKISLDIDSTTTLKEEIDFDYYQEYLDEDIIILDFNDIKEYVKEE